MGLIKALFGREPPKSGGADPTTSPSDIDSEEVVDPTKGEN